MFKALRRRQPGKPVRRILGWHVLHLFCFAWIGVLHRYRSFGVRQIPKAGPVLFVANHQSFLDPILVGLGAHARQPHAMARATLFRHPIFAGLIRFLNAIPVDQAAGDLKAMRRCIDALRQGQALLVFPEGARTQTGEVGSFASGTLLLIKRAKPIIVPVAIDGAFEVWPRWRKLPRPWGQVMTRFGRPIAAETLLAESGDAGLARLRDEIDAMRRKMRDRRLGRASACRGD